MAKKNPSFEESLQRLEEIVERLEGEEPTLAEAVKLYEEGTALAASCRKELEEAEMTITRLRPTEDGGDFEEEFELE